MGQARSWKNVRLGKQARAGDMCALDKFVRLLEKNVEWGTLAG